MISYADYLLLRFTQWISDRTNWSGRNIAIVLALVAVCIRYQYSSNGVASAIACGIYHAAMLLPQPRGFRYLILVISIAELLLLCLASAFGMDGLLNLFITVILYLLAPYWVAPKPPRRKRQHERKNNHAFQQ